MRRNSSDSAPGTAVAGAVERLLEAEAGLDRDHEQVEDVGQLAARSPSARSSIFRLRSTSGYMNDTPHEHADADEQRSMPWKWSISRTAGSRATTDTDAEQLQHQDLVDVEVRRVARVHELLRDLLAVALRA